MGDQRERKVKLDQRDTHPLPVNMRGDGQERRVRNASPVAERAAPLGQQGWEPTPRHGSWGLGQHEGV